MTWAPPPPPFTSGYSYPVMPAADVPAMHHRLSHRRLWLVSVLLIVVVAGAVTAVAVAVRPGSRACGYFCGPNLGPPLGGQSVYTSRTFNMSIEYATSRLQLVNQSDSGVSFAPLNSDGSSADGEIDFALTGGSGVDAAIASAVAALPSATIQNMQEIGPVRGAEIGLVLGSGTAYSATYVPSDGGQSVPIGVVVIGATDGTVTVTATMFSGTTKDIAAAPYGLDQANTFDYPITNTHFPSG